MNNSFFSRWQPVHLFFLASLLLLAQSLPLFSPNWIPFGDGLFRYEIFYWFYSDFLFQGELPLWMPYGSYGMPAFYYQWTALSPASYLVGLLGKILAVTDTRLLFNWATILESWAFILGVIFLAQHLFSQTIARLFVVLGAVFSLSWWGQPYLNLQLYYGLPWLFYWLIRCREEGRLSFLWLAGVVEILSLLGNFPYAAIFHIWIVFFFSLPALFARKTLPWPRWQTGGHWFWLVFFLFLAVIFLWFALAGLDGLVNLAPGRDALNQRVSLHEFLTYGHLEPATLLFNQLTGTLPHWEQDNYVGLAPLFLFPFALLRVASPWLRGFALASLFLVGLSLGKMIPNLAYHLPAMDHVRHISYMLVTAKVLILFASGFAIQHLTEEGNKSNRNWFSFFMVFLLVADLWQMPWQPLELQNSDWQPLLAGRLVVYALAGLALFFIKRNQQKGWILLAAFLLDVASYQVYVIRHLPMANPPYSPAFFQAKPLPYLPQRSQYSGKIITTPLGRSSELVRLFSSRGDFAYNLPLIYTFGHHDPCYPQTRLELFSQPVVTMLESRGGKPRAPYDQIYQLGETVHGWQREGKWYTFNRPMVAKGQEIAVGGHHLLPANDKFFWQALGCGSYKLRLVNKVTTVADEQQAIAKLATLADPGAEVVIIAKEERGTTVEHEGWNLEITDFTSNRLAATVVVEGREDRWLYYADGWHPHWQATVDGGEVPIHRAQIGFKAISLPPGEHQVVWQFHGGWAGVWANLLAVVAVVLTLAGGGAVLYALTRTRREEFH